jgi:hypothetical protein
VKGVARAPIEVRGECPHCHRRVDLGVAGDGKEVRCPACRNEILVQLGDLFYERGAIDRCLLCAGRHLYRQKDFNQRAGCAILAAGAIVGLILSWRFSILWLWGVLLAAAGLDALLYALVPEVVICYKCKAHYRGMAPHPAIEPFDLELADAIEGKMGGGLHPPPDAAP